MIALLAFDLDTIRTTLFLVGEPLEVPRIETPTLAQLDEIHAMYLERLRKLYDKYNPIYGSNKPLVFM